MTPELPIRLASLPPLRLACYQRLLCCSECLRFHRPFRPPHSQWWRARCHPSPARIHAGGGSPCRHPSSMTVASLMMLSPSYARKIPGCVLVVGPPPVGHRPINIGSSVLSLQMKGCQKSAKAAKAKAKAKVDAAVVSPGTDSRTASNLQVCSNSYDDTLDNLNDATIAVKAKDKGAMNSMLSALVTDFSTCEDSFSAMNARSPQAAVDKLLTKMASNCLTLASLL